ncbi:MAG: hypothetical protein P4L33_10035 [Capsulimonadaceae bacterium]|nr:hypothetical protein [Capsulimonadaceae bacterium]
MTNSSQPPSVPICQLGSTNADTIEVLLPTQAPVQAGRVDVASFGDRGGKWWETWAAVFTATSIVTPVVDHVRLLDILNETRRIRFCCDTNALCTGVAAWLLFILDGRVDVFTSAVVDRELSAWPDRKPGFWQAKSVDLWHLRTHYRLARRIIETPPDGVVVDRLSPDQSALMLAKLRDETSGKSPDADILLIELARGIARDQPKNARLVYLTGDKNNARAATSALGANNVLYAVSDGAQTKSAISEMPIRVLGWWRPIGPLGTVLKPDLSRLIWNFLAACDFIILETAKTKWRITPHNSCKTGTPADWDDPWLDIYKQVVSTSLEDPATPRGPLDDANAEDIIDGVLPTSEGRHAESVGLKEWIFQPRGNRVMIDAPSGRRPSPKAVFSLLWRSMGGNDPRLAAEVSSELELEARNILLSLGAIDEHGGAGARSAEFAIAWNKNDLDWFHGEFLRLPGYANALDRIREDGTTKFSSRSGSNVTMARALGQVARYSYGELGNFVGDAAVSVEDLYSALDRWLPNPGDTLSTDQLCERAAAELMLTPYRFEIAMKSLWGRERTTPFEGRTGGSVVAGPTESVVALGSTGYNFQPVAPGTLTFGREGPVRFIARTAP